MFEQFRDTNIKQLENSMETHKVYVEMFDIHSISYSANANTMLEIFPCTPQVTHRPWLRPVKFAL
jgi:hypothetical protein